MFFFLSKFRAHIVRSSACKAQLLPCFNTCAKTKVYHFDNFVLIDKHILELQISMHYVFRMHVLYCISQLFKYYFGFTFLNLQLILIFLSKVRIQTFTLNIFHNKIHFHSCIYGVIQLYYIGMIQSFKDINFFLQRLFPVRVMN